MTARHFIGIDAGGTVAKAAVFDLQGRELAQASAPMQDRHPRPGWTERDPDAMWQAVAGAVRALLAMPGISAAQIAAVCCTGHGNGIYPVDAQGRPSTAGIPSSDARALPIVRELEQRPDHARLVARLGQRFRPSAMPALLLWLDRHAPQMHAATAHVLLCKDYLRLRLTGKAATELSDISGSGILDFGTRHYDDGLLAELGLLHWRSRLPDILHNSAVAGHVTAAAAAQTGLLEGTPVAAGMMDVDAVTLASGVIDSRQMAVCGGTWSINLMLSSKPCQGSRVQDYPLLQIWHRDGQACVVCEGSPTSASNLAWLLENVLGQARPDYAQLNALVAGLAPEDSALLYLPYIHGADGEPKAGFIGMDSSASLAHMLRAVYEGVAFEHARHIEAVLALSGAAPECLRLSGGVAQSEVWSQMLADVTGLRVEIAQGQELGALGCAICAAVAVQAYPDFLSAIAAMTRVARHCEPDAARHAVYRSKRAQQGLLLDALAPLWPQLGRCR